MRKHYKLLSSIVCLVLCACMIAFGVYAATSGLSFTVSSQVSFSPTTAKLKIFGGIANYADTEDQESGTSFTYYACNYGDGENTGTYTTTVNENIATDTFTAWNFGKIKFAEYAESDGKPKPIYFYIQITNYVERNVQYSIVINNDSSSESSSILNYVDVKYGYYLKENTASELKGAEATSSGWWSIENTTASAPSFHSSTSTAQNPNYNPKFDRSFTFSEELNLTNVDTSLSTIMLVVKLDLKDAHVDDSFDPAGFNFTVNAV